MNLTFTVTLVKRMISKFNNIFGNSANQIPLGSTIVEANLSLNIDSDIGVANPFVFILRENFTETEVTWNNRTSSATWGSAGAIGPPSADTSILSVLRHMAWEKAKGELQAMLQSSSNVKLSLAINYRW